MRRGTQLCWLNFNKFKFNQLFLSSKVIQPIDLLTRIKEDLRKEPVFDHPFLHRFGQMHPDQLARFLREQNELTRVYPHLIARLYGNAPDLRNGHPVSRSELAQPLLPHIIYNPYFRNFASLPQESSDRCVTETIGYVRSLEGACQDPFPSAVAAIGYGLVFGDCIAAPKILAGMKQIAEDHSVIVADGLFRDLNDAEAIITPFETVLSTLIGSAADRYTQLIPAAAKNILLERKRWYDKLNKELFKPPQTDGHSLLTESVAAGGSLEGVPEPVHPVT